MRRDDVAKLDGFSLDQIERALDRHTRKKIPVDRYSEFSWSVSRRHLFETCKRAFYLNYYGSRRVQEANDPVISAVWWLKQVTSLPAWIGTVIHQVAGEAMRDYRDRGRVTAAARLREQGLRLYREGLQASSRGSKHRELGWVVLPYDVYPAALDAGEADASAGRVAALCDTLAASEAYRWISSLPPEALLEVDEPFQSFEFETGGPLGAVRAFAIPDVLVQHEGQIHIIDWKTGDVSEEGLRWQAGVYRYYAQHRYRVDAERIQVRLANLAGDGASVEPVGGLPTLLETEEFMRESIAAMLERMDDSEYNSVVIQHYPMVDDLSICASCGFRAACKRQVLGLR